MLEEIILSLIRALREFFSMKPVRFILLTALACFVAYIVVSGVAYELSPWTSETKVRPRVLALTPIGSSMEKVKSVLKSEHWPICYEMRLDLEKHGTVVTDYPGVKGVYAIGADLGRHFGLPFPYGVDAYWGFDQNGKMIDLKVRVSPEGI